MSTTTTTHHRNVAVAVATTPWAISGITSHLIDHKLPIPATIEIHLGEVRMWVGRQEAAAWRRHADVLGDIRHERKHDHHLHVANLRLHGSGVLAQLRWITFIDHVTCESSDEDCNRAVCYCRDVDLPCAGAVAQGCHHVSRLCGEHAGECSECRIEAAS